MADGWYWLTQKSSKGCWDADIGLCLYPGLLGLLTWRMRAWACLDISISGPWWGQDPVSLSRIGDSESVHSYIPSSITWLRPVFWALGTGTGIFCLILFIIDQNEEQSFCINCQVTGCHSSVNWDLRPIINEKRNFPLPATPRLSLAADRW